MTPLRKRMIDDMTLHGLEPNTIKAYVQCVARFARHFGKSPDLLGTAEIRSYLLYLTHDRNVSASTYNQALCALKFLYRVTLKKDWGLDGLARSRRHHRPARPGRRAASWPGPTRTRLRRSITAVIITAASVMPSMIVARALTAGVRPKRTAE